MFDRLILQFCAELYLRQYRQNSILSHRLDLVRFTQWALRNHPRLDAQLSWITPALLKDYTRDLTLHLKPRSVNRHLSSLRAFFAFLHHAGMLPRKMSEEVHFLPYLTPLPQTLPSRDIRALLLAPDLSTPYGLRDRCILDLLYGCLLKIRELVALNVTDLDLETGLLQVDAGRKLPLSRFAMEHFPRYLAGFRQNRAQGSSCLFPGKKGNRLTRIGVWKLVQRHAKTAGLTTAINPRILRHSMVQHLIGQGVNLRTIQYLLGLGTLEGTAGYRHIQEAHSPQVLEAYLPQPFEVAGNSASVPDEKSPPKSS